MTGDDLREQYRAAVLAWGEAQVEPRQAKRLFDSLHDFAKRLRETEAGRSAMYGLARSARARGPRK